MQAISSAIGHGEPSHELFPVNCNVEFLLSKLA